LDKTNLGSFRKFFIKEEETKASKKSLAETRFKNFDP
jgi:hypothetical protein